MSPERLNRIATAVERCVEGGHIAGAVSVVMRHGHIVWTNAAGFSDREAQTAMKEDAIFRICSMTRPITSVAVMMLYEEGRFQLSDPVAWYLPEFDKPMVASTDSDGKHVLVPASRPIRIIDLLRHTSGLTYHWNEVLGPEYIAANVGSGFVPFDGTLEENVHRIAKIPLLFNPGDKFEYGLSTDVLGRLVEVVSGMDFDQFLRMRIFEPLDLRDTYFYPPEEKLPRLVVAYAFQGDEGLVRFPESPMNESGLQYSADYPYRGPQRLFSGGYGLCSTARDYARFCQMLLNGGMLDGVRLLSRKTVELMTSDHLGDIEPKRGFGLGFGVDGIKAPMNEVGSPGRYGWGGFFYTEFTIDPKEDMIVLFFAQLHPAGNLNIAGVVKSLAYVAIEQ